MAEKPIRPEVEEDLVVEEAASVEIVPAGAIGKRPMLMVSIFWDSSTRTGHSPSRAQAPSPIRFWRKQLHSFRRKPTRNYSLPKGR